MAVLVTDELTDAQTEMLAKIKDAETAMLEFAADWKYIPTLPRGPQGERAILLLDYLIPDLAHIVAAHYISRGWRRHDPLAIIKPRKIVGGMFEDLVAYVPMDEPDEPVVVPYQPQADPPSLDALPWSVKPVVTETFEERPDDD
jgi:hypothetical protein